MLRTGILITFLSLLVGCVTSGPAQPMRTAEGREQARQAYIDLAVGYLREGMTGQAKVPLQNVLKINPNDSEALEILALVFQQEMEPELAEKNFKKALSNKRDTRILNNYGSFLFEQERYDEAYNVFSEAAKDTMYLSRSRVFENLGMTALRLDRAEDAYHYFQRALRLDAQQPISLLELGTLSYERKDYIAARRYYESFVSISEHNAASLLLGVRLAKIFEDRDQAASLGLQLKRLYPASAEYQAYRTEQ
ncbi:type IV pilus biogenesis/stability protein PilW [Thiopseudomonas acetoxidans]|uniref:Type IV pilus biogenesis/stability protein PilW n=1 Tax=Thiopseudomonas acetoxidans TaxID=3041622 RepID=A0ABT7SQT8_9GAMM|nr:type IV pilus biogenesis/stability protein PilW [Thiopseudomonas sp. CY1220]MDM7858550.1 type IV pilus biogenesis/stability protein PilW [Thiopseudomonas sp. CY1220]